MTDQDYKIADNLPASIDLAPIPDLARVVDVELSAINPDLLLIYPAIDTLGNEAYRPLSRADAR